jgi:4-hydroxybenzoate polyprenyltransferase
VLLGGMTELLWIGSRAVQIVGRRFTAKRPPGRLSLKRAYYFSTVLALGPTMALAMLSIGSFGVYEMLLIIVFLAVACLYVSKRSSH